MMNTIAIAIREKSFYGVRARAYIGAVVSFTDMISDAFMAYEFSRTGRGGTAQALLFLVLGNVFCQSALVYMQTRNTNKKTMAFEFLSVVTFTKPGFDAYRVANGMEQPSGVPLDPLKDMVCTKICEIVFEAIPGLVLQLVAFIKVKDKTAFAMVSIFISAASTAFTGSTIFFDLDTDPKVKRQNPTSSGIIPNSGRGGAFLSVLLICGLQVLAKAFATALLFVTDKSWLFYYICGDHALHIVYRIIRNDFIFFVPAPKVMSYLLFPIFRVVTKVINDFTGTPLTRLRLFMGGCYYLFNLITSQVSVFVAVYLYNNYADVAEGERKISAETLWAGSIALAAAWLINFLYFARFVAVPRLRHTLWNTLTGRQCVQEYFLMVESDEHKFHIFSNNLLLWKSEIGEDVKAWTFKNWATWKQEEPEWFKEVRMSKCGERSESRDGLLMVS